MKFIKSWKFISKVTSKLWEGLKTDPAKVKAVEEMPQPSCRQEVLSLLGFVNYLSRFLPWLADVAQPLRELTSTDAKFTWAKHYDTAFKKVKKLVVNHPILKHYDCNADVTLHCDAIGKGLGAVLLQNGQSVAFASITLSATERRYTQIEKECLAFVFACQRFSQYISRREKVTVRPQACSRHFQEISVSSSVQIAKDATPSTTVQFGCHIQTRFADVHSKRLPRQPRRGRQRVSSVCIGGLNLQVKSVKRKATSSAEWNRTGCSSPEPEDHRVGRMAWTGKPGTYSNQRLLELPGWNLSASCSNAGVSSFLRRSDQRSLHEVTQVTLASSRVWERSEIQFSGLEWTVRLRKPSRSVRAVHVQNFRHGTPKSPCTLQKF